MAPRMARSEPEVRLDYSLSFWIPVALALSVASAVTLYSAFNRPGKGRYLCEDCRFNEPGMCLKAERPRALACTSYRSTDGEDEARER